MSSYQFLNPKKLSASVSSSTVDTSDLEKKLAALQTRISELESKQALVKEGASAVEPQAVPLNEGCCCASSYEKVAFPDYKSQGEHEMVDIVANAEENYSKQLYFTSGKDQLLQYTHNKTNDTLHAFYTADNADPSDVEQYAVLKRNNNYSIVNNGLFVDDQGQQLSGNYVGAAFSGRVWLGARENALALLSTGDTWNPFTWTSDEMIPLTSPDENGNLFAFGDVKYAEDMFLVVGAKYRSYWDAVTPPTFTATADGTANRTAILNAMGAATVNGIMTSPRIITADKDGMNGAVYSMVNTDPGATNQIRAVTDLPAAGFAPPFLTDGTEYTINWAGIRLTDVSYLKVDCTHDVIAATGFFELVLTDNGTGDEVRITAGVTYTNYGFAPAIQARWTSFLVFYDPARQGPTYPLHGASDSTVYGGATPILPVRQEPILADRAFVTASSGYKSLMLSEVSYGATLESIAATISEMDFTIDEMNDRVTNVILIYSEPISYLFQNSGPQRVTMLSHQFGSQTTASLPDPADNELVVYHKPLMVWTGSEWVVSVRDADNVYHVIAANYENFVNGSTQVQSIEVGVHDFGIATVWNGGVEYAAANLQDANDFSGQLAGIGTDMQWLFRSDKAQVTGMAYPYTDDPTLPVVVIDEVQIASGAYNNVLYQPLDALLGLSDTENANLMQVRHNVEGYFDYQCEPATTLLVTEGPTSGPGGLTWIEGDDIYTSAVQLQDNYACAYCGGYYVVGRRAANGRKAIVFTNGRVDEPADQWDGRTWNNNSRFYIPTENGSSANGNVYPGYTLYNGGNSGPPAIHDIYTYYYTDSSGIRQCFFVAVGRPIALECTYHFIWVSPGVQIEGGQRIMRWYSAYWRDSPTTGYTIERLDGTLTGGPYDQVYNDRLLVGASGSRIFLFSPVDSDTATPTPVQSPQDLLGRNKWCLLARISDLVTQYDLAGYGVVGIKYEKSIQQEPPANGSPDEDYRLGLFPRLAILLNDQSPNTPLWDADDAFAMFGDLQHTMGSGWDFVLSHVTDLTDPFYVMYRYGLDGFAVGGDGIRIWNSTSENWEPAVQAMLAGVVYDLFDLGAGTYAAVGQDSQGNGTNGLFYSSNIESQPFSLVQGSDYPVWSACLKRPDCCIATDPVPAICNQTNTVVTLPQYFCLGQQTSWRVCYNITTETPDECPDLPDPECIVDNTTAAIEAKTRRSISVAAAEPERALVGCRSCGH